MELKVNQVTNGSTVYFTSNNVSVDEHLITIMHNIKNIKKEENGLYVFNNDIIEYTYDEHSCNIFSTFKEAIDNIRHTLKGHDMNNIFKFYIDYLVTAINCNTPVYIIRERKVRNIKDRKVTYIKDRYMDESIILEIKYDKSWKIKTKSVDKIMITTHSCNALGKKIFFSKENAYKRLYKLKNGIELGN